MASKRPLQKTTTAVSSDPPVVVEKAKPAGFGVFFQNAVQTSLINATGTLLSQGIVKNLSGKTIEFDFAEVFVMIMISFFYMTPILMIFFSKLNSMKGGVVAKLVVDQFVFSPFFTTGIIALRLIFYTKADISTVPALLYTIVPKAMQSAWLFWVPARFIVISYISEDKHMLVSNVLSLFWNIIFTMTLNQK